MVYPCRIAHQWVGYLFFSTSLKEKPLIPLEPATPSGDGVVTVLAVLQEWKVVHTEMQSLLDQLSVVINRLNRCQFEPTLFQHNLYDIEESWRQCVPRIRAVSLISFAYIGEEGVIKSVQRLVNKVRGISRQIADASNLADAQHIETEIRDINEEIAPVLSVADRKIVELVNRLLSNGTVR